MVRLQVMVFMFGKIKINLKANGLKTYVMEMVVTFSTMETSMSGSMLMGNLMGLDNINGQMDPHTQEISKWYEKWSREMAKKTTDFSIRSKMQLI